MCSNVILCRITLCSNAVIWRCTLLNIVFLRLAINVEVNSEGTHVNFAGLTSWLDSVPYVWLKAVDKPRVSSVNMYVCWNPMSRMIQSLISKAVSGVGQWSHSEHLFYNNAGPCIRTHMVSNNLPCTASADFWVFARKLSHLDISSIYYDIIMMMMVLGY